MARLITKEGLKKLEDELEQRSVARRQEIAGSIKEAKEQGDLSENAEYSEAKSEQNENESRIAQLEVMIKDVEVVEKDSSDGTVGIGSEVTVKVKGKEFIFKLVGSTEVNPEKQLISNESPIGSALMGRAVGDKAPVETPVGKMVYEITKVSQKQRIEKKEQRIKNQSDDWFFDVIENNSNVTSNIIFTSL